MNLLSFKNEYKIIFEDRDFLIVQKPHGVPSVPLFGFDGINLLSLIAETNQEVLSAAATARNKIEGGIMHRIDNETFGLVLVARNSDAADFFYNEQKAGRIVKGYTAITARNFNYTEGFPTPLFETIPLNAFPISIQSKFRYYGKGRKSVRPVRLDEKREKILKKAEKNIYTTDVISIEENDGKQFTFRVSLSKGFRHQVRCHLAWHGYPIIGDKIYGGMENHFLQLYADSICFLHPGTKQKVCFEI